eukprot:4799864-Prymnesium_polylepis.1
MKDRSAVIARSQLCRSNVVEVARPHRVSSSAAATAREAFQRSSRAAHTDGHISGRALRLNSTELAFRPCYARVHIGP